MAKPTAEKEPEISAAHDAVAPLPPLKPLPAYADKADDLESLRKAVDDAAGVGGGLWLSYLFVLFYLLVAAGSVTHEDLFFVTPVRLPFLGVDLPMTGFFVLGPGLFLIAHAYVLLHFGMLAGKIRAFDTALRTQLDTVPEIRAALRRQLPSNVFLQFLAGPPEVRDGAMGLALWLIALISVVIGPIALLVFFQLQFLPYHDEVITWWHRCAVGLDLVLIWVFWPAIALDKRRGDHHSGRSSMMARWQRHVTLATMWLLGAAGGLLVLVFATFPGEAIDRVLWEERQFSLPSPFPEIREFLIDGEIDDASRQPKSLRSNKLVLPGLDIVAHLKLDTEEKVTFAAESLSLRKRNLDGAVLIGAVLRRVDFTGASLRHANFLEADPKRFRNNCMSHFSVLRENDPSSMKKVA